VSWLLRRRDALREIQRFGQTTGPSSGLLGVCVCHVLYFVLRSHGESIPVTVAPERLWGQISQMQAGKVGASQRSPSLLLYIAVQEPWKGPDTRYT
jgi:hypothetical protein